jgi:hypothetical protein
MCFPVYSDLNLYYIKQGDRWIFIFDFNFIEQGDIMTGPHYLLLLFSLTITMVPDVTYAKGKKQKQQEDHAVNEKKNKKKKKDTSANHEIGVKKPNDDEPKKPMVSEETIATIEPTLKERVIKFISNHKVPFGATVTALTAGTVFVIVRQFRATGQGMFRGRQGLQLDLL